MCNWSCLWEFYLAYGPSKAPIIVELQAYWKSSCEGAKMCNSSCLWEFYLAYGPSKAPAIPELQAYWEGSREGHSG